jgi:hypothetical protein
MGSTCARARQRSSRRFRGVDARGADDASVGGVVNRWPGRTPGSDDRLTGQANRARLPGWLGTRLLHRWLRLGSRLRECGDLGGAIGRCCTAGAAHRGRPLLKVGRQPELGRIDGPQGLIEGRPARNDPSESVRLLPVVGHGATTLRAQHRPQEVSTPRHDWYDSGNCHSGRDGVKRPRLQTLRRRSLRAGPTRSDHIMAIPGEPPESRAPLRAETTFPSTPGPVSAPAARGAPDRTSGTAGILLPASAGPQGPRSGTAAAGHRSRGRARLAQAVKTAATAAGNLAPATPAGCTAPSGQPSGSLAEGGAYAPPVGPRRHGARLPGPDPAAAGAVAGSRGGEVDFGAASRCPLLHDADSRPVEGVAPEVLEVIAVAVEIALQQRHAQQAA